MNASRDSPTRCHTRATHTCMRSVARNKGWSGSSERWGWTCRSLMSRAWLNLGATSSSSSAAHTCSWLTAPHESQAHGSPVCNGASNDTRTREWLAALSETPGRSRAGDTAASNETSTRSWLQPVASAQPTTNSSTAPMGKRRAWMEPSAIVEPQAKRQQMDGSNRSRSWLEPSAILDP